MKNILVATDFSDIAHTAAVYAAKLACSAGCRIILLHTYSIRDVAADSDKQGRKPCIEKRRQAKMDKLAHELHDQYGVSVTRLLKPGFAADEIPALARRVKADVVVMACCCLQQLQNGETTASLLAQGQLALLLVPPLAVFTQAAGMAYAQEPNGQGIGKNLLILKLQKVYGTGCTLQPHQTAIELEAIHLGSTAVATAAMETVSLLQLQPNQLLVIQADATKAALKEILEVAPVATNLSHPILVLPC